MYKTIFAKNGGIFVDKAFQKYFLGANSGEGFVSHFTDNYNCFDGWRAFIIKGGPGSGKSSFMKYVAVKAADRGYKTELCPCSSDPDSLDGLIIKDLKTVIIDGTAPHVAEPKYPGACEQIINLGAFWNGEALYENAEKIISVTNQNKKLHTAVSAYISAAGELIYDNFMLSRQCADRQKVERFAENASQRLIPKKANRKPREWVRFLCGVTPKGIIAYGDTVERFYKNIIVIDDKYGGVSNTVMNTVRETALSRGYEIITVKNPFLPSKITDHILIPELSLAFVREYEYMSFSKQYRRIHSRRFTDINSVRAVRNRITFNRRAARELLLGAVNTLSKAKAVHDEIEKYYIDAMDFSALTRFAEEKANQILSRNV